MTCASMMYLSIITDPGLYSLPRNTTTLAGSSSTRGHGRTRSTKGFSAGWRCTGAVAGEPSGFSCPLAAHSRSKLTPGSTLWGLDLFIRKRYAQPVGGRTHDTSCHLVFIVDGSLLEAHANNAYKPVSPQKNKRQTPSE